MTKSEYNQRLRIEVEILKQQFRSDNSAFLIWFLKNIYCLSEQDSVDAVCDGPRDKGIDGIWVDEIEDEIYVFQSEFSPNDDRDSGDTKIREFGGVLTWFANEESVNRLSVALINNELKQRLTDLKIGEKINRGDRVIFVYVTNKIFDRNANEYLENTEIEAYDNNTLFSKYTYMVEEDVANTSKTFNLSISSAIQYDAEVDTPSIVAAIPVLELLKMDGIQDHTLFARNVRLWTGKTRVNKELAATINNRDEHKKIFLYHNGISIICNDFKYNIQARTIDIEGYQVINGCQSLVSFYQNRLNLTEDITILTKIIKIQSQSPLIQKITKNANNQNAITLKDLKSNDRVQISIQRQFFEFFNNTVMYVIKRGEAIAGYSDVIDVDYAAQLILSFYFSQPYRTHQKAGFYGNEYEDIFSRNITCQKIYLAYVIHQIIQDSIDKIDNIPVRSYGLARFNFLRIIHTILQNDNLGRQIIANPDQYVLGNKLIQFRNSIEQLFQLVALDINAFISEESAKTPLFDYKNLFKKKDFCDKMDTEVMTNQRKSIIRHQEDSFENIFASFAKE